MYKIKNREEAFEYFKYTCTDFDAMNREGKLEAIKSILNNF